MKEICIRASSNEKNSQMICNLLQKKDSRHELNKHFSSRTFKSISLIPSTNDKKTDILSFDYY